MSQTSILDSLTWYHFRWNTTEHDPDFVKKQLKEMNTCMYVGGYETNANRHHWQLAVQHNSELKEFRALIKKHFNPSKNSYSISSKKQTVERLATYLCKEERLISFGIPDSLLERMTKLTFKKSKGDPSYYELDNEFLTTDMSTKTYITRYIAIKLSQRQRWQQRHLLNHLLMLDCKRDPTIEKKIVSKYVAEYNNFYIGDY